MKHKKSIKRITSFFLFIGLISLFAGCQKYEDGPTISFRSKKERVSNTWKVENYKINGSDYTSLVADYQETFSKAGDYSYTWGILSGSGEWSFTGNKENIQLIGTDNQSDRTLYIQKLEENEFWYYYIDGSDTHTFHMVTK